MVGGSDASAGVEFGRFRALPRRRELLADGQPAKLGGRAFDVLMTLIEAHGAVVSKDALMERVWPGQVVEENNLQAHISALRSALGADRNLIRTVSGRGYQFIGELRSAPEDSTERGRLSPAAGPEALPRTNVPDPISELIGRDEELAELANLVGTHRLVTLTGAGGIGKTRLAVALARESWPHFADGVWLVQLSSLTDPRLVPAVVAAAVGLELGGEASVQSVAKALANRQSLLVLDTCEHVIEVAASLAEAVLGVGPGLRILATSRELLRAQGEWVYAVPPLAVPATDVEGESLFQYGAVRLFLARARAADPYYAPDQSRAASIVAICRRLDGIPLAIELAATQASALGVETLAVRLGDRFDLLTGGRRTVLPRQQTLRATLDWSHALLDEPERVLLRRLAIFAGVFSLKAVRSVVIGPDLSPSAAVNGITSLIAKSLVVVESDRHLERYRLLDMMRAYAAEKLDESGESKSLARRHAEFYRDDFERAEFEWESRSSSEWLSDYVWSVDNVRAALDWAFSPDGDTSIGVTLTAATVPLLMHSSLLAECRERCERALSADPKPEARQRMRLQIGFGNGLLHTRGPSEQARTALTEALESAEALGDLRAQLRVLLDLSSVDGFRGEYASAAAASERARAIARQTGDAVGAGFADRRMGMTLLRTGRLAEARYHFEQVIHSSPSRGEKGGLPHRQQADDSAMARALLARVLCLQGFPETAHQEARASLDEVGGADRQVTLCRVLFYGMGRIAPMTGDFVAAEAAVTRIIEAAASAAVPFWTMAGQFLRGKLLVERHEFSEGLAVLRDAFTISNRTGWRLSHPEFMGSLALALAGLGRFDDARDAVDQAIEAADAGDAGQQWYGPELLRIKGEVQLRLGRDQPVQAAACFAQAADLARKQGALFWELRTAVSAARLRVRQEDLVGAAQLLRPVYDRFTEGFESADLKAAKTLLDTLP
jgi:predicted ATPase/DNA-binding winged helix-turn-helix (wHTH) protein